MALDPEAEGSLPMPQATASETAERVEHLQGMILAGQSNTVCLTFARQTWDLTVAGLPAAEEGVAADQGRHRRERHRPAGVAVVVNPDADGRGWTGDAAEEPWCCGGLHPQLDHMPGTGYNSHRGYGFHRRLH